MKIRAFSLSFIIIITIMLISVISLIADLPAVFGEDTWGGLGEESGIDAGCTSFMVGKEASADGSTLITINQDTPSYSFNLLYVPAEDHPDGTVKKLADYPQWCRDFDSYGNPIDADQEYTGVEIAEVPHTYAYLKSLFGVMNEHQVSMAMSTLTGIRNGLANKTGKLKMTILSFVAMERARTAREAIKVITELAEKYGFSSEYTPGKNLMIADPDEIWMLHMMQVGPSWMPGTGIPGAVWVAQRVPDDHVSVFPNGFAIGEIDLNNPDYFMASSNIQSLAVEQGWYDPAEGNPFNVREAYTGGRVASFSTVTRKWRGYQLLAPHLTLPDPAELPSLKRPDNRPYFYPFSVKAEKKISAADLTIFVRDTYEGTKYDLSKGPLAGPFGSWHRNQIDSVKKVENEQGSDELFLEVTGITNDSTQFAQICQMRGWLPDPIGGIVWWAPGPPKTAAAVPFYCGITGLSSHYSHGDHFNFQWGKTAGWAAVFINTLSDVLYSQMIEDIKKFQTRVEETAFSRTEEVDNKALELYKTDPQEAEKFLTGYCNNFGDQITALHWEFAEFLIWKYHNRYIWQPEQSQRPEMQEENWWYEKTLEYRKENDGLILEQP